MRSLGTIFALLAWWVHVPMAWTQGAAAAKAHWFDEMVPVDTDEIQIQDWAGKTTRYVIKGTNLHAELAARVEFLPAAEHWICNCSGSARIQFRHKGVDAGVWTIHHGSFFGRTMVSVDTDRRIAEWFAQKGVPDFREWVESGKGSYDPPPPPPPSWAKPLAYLRATQNPDGSWGMPAQAVQETSLVVLALLHLGQTPGSDDGGPAMEKAVLWLMAQRPHAASDRVVHLHAIFQCAKRTGIPQVTEAGRRLRAAGGDLPGEWRPLWRKLNVDGKKSAPDAKPGQTTWDHHLAQLVQSPGGERYARLLEFARELPADAMEPDGALRLTEADSRVASTALRLLSTWYYLGDGKEAGVRSCLVPPMVSESE